MPFVSSCAILYNHLNENSGAEKNNEPENNDAKSEINVSHSGNLRFEYALVTDVIDGDTVILEDGESVRLIGINAPEKGMQHYNEAKEFLEILVLNQKVRLEKDLTNRDIYGRLLRYVFTSDIFVNFEMVKNGFANQYDYPPDVKYSSQLKEAEKLAEQKQLGVWEKSCFSLIKLTLNYDAKGNDEKNLNDEWVKISYSGEEDLNLNNWTIKDYGTSIYRFGEVILSKSQYVIVYSGKGTDHDNVLFWNSKKPIWNNKHDSIYLRDSLGNLVEFYSY